MGKLGLQEVHVPSLHCWFTKWILHWAVIAKNISVFSALPDILSPCQTFSPVDDWQISVAILVFLVGHLMRIEPCWTKCPAGSDLSAGHHQKSAGHVRHVRHISRSLHWGNFSYLPTFMDDPLVWYFRWFIHAHLAPTCPLKAVTSCNSVHDILHLSLTFKGTHP